MRFDLPMDRDDPPKVMMLHIEEIQLFFLAHPDGDRGFSDTQMIRQAIKKIQALSPLYSKALTNWNRGDPAHCKVWNNFKHCMYAQYNRMLAERGRGTLGEDGYSAFNVVATEDTQILIKSLMNYSE